MTVLLYPSCRPSQIPGAIQRALQTARVPDDLRFVVGANGPEKLCRYSSQLPGVFVIYFGEELFRPPYTEAVNRCMRVALRRLDPAAGSLIGYWADDHFPRKDWDTALQRAHSSTGKEVLAARDGIMNAGCATIPFVTRRWLEQHVGGMFWAPIYRYVTDVELFRKSTQTGDYLYVPTCRIDHHHFFAGTREKDEVDAHNEIRDNADWDLIEERTKLRFPVTWSPDELDASVPPACSDQSVLFVKWPP